LAKGASAPGPVAAPEKLRQLFHSGSFLPLSGKKLPLCRENGAIKPKTGARKSALFAH
jgi:hypothetical protein